MREDSTVNVVGAKTIHESTYSYKKQWYLVMLAVFADVEKLLPFIIYRRKMLPTAEKLLASVLGAKKRMAG